tara:strand:- start:527 stop:862 length:336 start_codon:yes stop_codon:yes gene_type:complete
MTNIEKLQLVWEAKDILAVKNMFTEDTVMMVHHENKVLNGKEVFETLDKMVNDGKTKSSDFRIIFENDECTVTFERISSQFFGGKVTIIHLWRGDQIHHMEISLIKDNIKK